MSFYAVCTYRDMMGLGLILKGGLVTRCDSLSGDESSTQFDYDSESSFNYEVDDDEDEQDDDME
jgi:hypothetical protein